MPTFAEILPLAITMMAGPQIIADVILITGKDPRRTSLAYVAAVGVAATLGTLGLFIVFRALGIDSLTNSRNGPLAGYIETALVALLVALAIKTYLRRSDVSKPKWMEGLQQARPKEAFRLGLTLILIMPSDLLIMITVALYLVSNGASFVEAAPFIVTTILIASIPLVLFILFQKRVVEVMPSVRRWMDDNNWVIQIGVYLIFVFLIWF